VIGGPGEVGICVGGEGHDAEAEALEQRDETENLLGLAAVAEQNCKIALGAQTEVTVERLGGIEKTGGDARAVEGGGDLLGDVGGFSDSAKNEFSAGRDGGFHGPGRRDKTPVQASRGGSESVTLDAEATARTGEGGFRSDGHL
jgi:hypothetical protein